MKLFFSYILGSATSGSTKSSTTMAVVGGSSSSSGGHLHDLYHHNSSYNETMSSVSEKDELGLAGGHHEHLRQVLPHLQQVGGGPPQPNGNCVVIKNNLLGKCFVLRKLFLNFS